MERVETIPACRALVERWRREARTVGFVPTMGFLHEGHISLVRRAKTECDRVIASIFVNPTQFGPTEDLARYPRDLAGDAAKLAGGGCDALFTTTSEEMYAGGAATWVTVERLTAGLCGASRPTHFRGVTTVVTKLFNIVRPDRAFFGEKDYQQVTVIRRMVSDLNQLVIVVPCPIVREADGLALSSRNVFLSPDERARATALSRGLARARTAFERGERRARALEEAVEREVVASGGRLDYAHVVDGEALDRREAADERSVLAVAAFYGKTRLIDNHALGRPFPAPGKL